MNDIRYCYPGSDVLINKYNIHDRELLEKPEIQKVTVKLLELWSIHPFREGNTRACVTFLWHYLKFKGVEFRADLIRSNPMYVRDSLVMANYDHKEYLQKIISDALDSLPDGEEYNGLETGKAEKYRIAESAYRTFRDKYSIRR